MVFCKVSVSTNAGIGGGPPLLNLAGGCLFLSFHCLLRFWLSRPSRHVFQPLMVEQQKNSPAPKIEQVWVWDGFSSMKGQTPSLSSHGVALLLLRPPQSVSETLPREWSFEPSLTSKCQTSRRENPQLGWFFKGPHELAMT